MGEMGPLDMLHRLLTTATKRLNGARQLWSVVYGPTAAMVATVWRLQWEVHSATQFTTDDGTRIDLVVDSPEYVKGVARKSVDRWRWKRIENKFPVLNSYGRGAGAWWKPILSVLRQKNSLEWGPHQKAALKSAIMGRQWTQQRLHKAKLVDDDQCQLCKDLVGGSCVGTLWHRVSCPALADFTAKNIPKWVSSRLQTDQMSDCMRFCLTRGMCPAPSLPERFSQEYNTFHWSIMPSADLPSGCRVFTDGSLLDGCWRGV